MPTIHQEASFSAPPARVYAALVDLKQFAELTGQPASGDSSVGGAFSAFDGYVTGRQIELVPNKRVVQAWRAKSWPEGVHSIVRFELQPDGQGTKLVFDHAGFPEKDHEHLASGWKSMYWERIQKYLA
jgi:activator of HSP90 ATPase